MSPVPYLHGHLDALSGGIRHRRTDRARGARPPRDCRYSAGMRQEPEVVWRLAVCRASPWATAWAGPSLRACGVGMGVGAAAARRYKEARNTLVRERWEELGELGGD